MEDKEIMIRIDKDEMRIIMNDVIEDICDDLLIYVGNNDLDGIMMYLNNMKRVCNG